MEENERQRDVSNGEVELRLFVKEAFVMMVSDHGRSVLTSEIRICVQCSLSVTRPYNPILLCLYVHHGEETYVCSPLFSLAIACSPLTCGKRLTTVHSQVAHYRRPPNFHGHDGLLQDLRPAQTAPSSQHVEI